MSVRAVALSAACCVLLIVTAALLLDLSLSRALVLAPVIVATAGATIFVVVLWTKVIWDSTRGRAKEDG